MAVNAADDPVAQAKQLIAEARQQFAKDVDAILSGVKLELRQVILERFDEQLPMRRLADPVLLQLLREAYDLLTNPESRVDLRDWERAVVPFVVAD